MLNIEGVEVRICQAEHAQFHAKVYIFSKDSYIHVFAGSNNATWAGLMKNIEAGYLVSGNADTLSISEAIKFFYTHWERNSITADEFIREENQMAEPKFQTGDEVRVIAN